MPAAEMLRQVKISRQFMDLSAHDITAVGRGHLLSSQKNTSAASPVPLSDADSQTAGLADYSGLVDTEHGRGLASYNFV